MRAGLYRGLTAVCAFTLSLSIGAGTLLEGYRSTIDSNLGTTSEKFVSTSTADEPLYENYKPSSDVLNADGTGNSRVLIQKGIDLGRKQEAEGAVLLKNNTSDGRGLPLQSGENVSLSDTYAVNENSAPSAKNMGDFTYANKDVLTRSAGQFGDTSSKYVIEAEGIYTGYKYYETRYYDAALGQGNATSEAGATAGEGAWNYDDEVTYSFGYGLSYTTFKQELMGEPEFSVTKGKNGETEAYATFKVNVTNTGDVAGKSAVQVYGQAPTPPAASRSPRFSSSASARPPSSPPAPPMPPRPARRTSTRTSSQRRPSRSPRPARRSPTSSSTPTGTTSKTARSPTSRAPTGARPGPRPTPTWSSRATSSSAT